MKPLYPKSNRTWATGLQDLHWDFQSQVMEMKMYFQYYFIIIEHYFQYHIIFQVLDLNDPKLVQAIWKPEVLFLEFFLATRQTQNMLCSYILDQVYFPNAKEAEFQYVTVPNLLLSIKPLGQILYMLRSQFSCKHHNHIPKSLSTI